MSFANLPRLGLGLLFSSILAASSSATTYVVDASGGGQFTDIQPAIAAARPGDVLRVMQGVYSGFTLDKGLVIIGYGTVTIAGDASVTGVPTSETAAIVRLAPVNVTIYNCAGAVLVQDLGTVFHISAHQSNDVRIRGVTNSITDGPTVDACIVTQSRVELVRCTLRGSNGADCLSSIDGGMGLSLTGSSRAQVALSNVNGGYGSNCSSLPFPQFWGGDGAPAIWIGATDTMFLTGGGQSFVIGGGGGTNYFYTDNCSFDGLSAAGIQRDGGSLWHSGSTIIGPPNFYGIHCVRFPGIPIGGTGPVTAVAPDDPTLDVLGTLTAGSGAQFILRAPAGSSAILYFGRRALVIPDPNTQIEQLTTKSRIVHLGTIPPSGQATFTWPISASSPAGTLLVAQAEVTVAPGDLRHTNSIPVVVR